ncbi:hypothetical protein ACSHWG_08515 [Leucobacter sp. Z1108]|uniref:hypothetical protein n=1 Tax=Leucobacter sp. Z1108 TaxID=3439066 RepID=UPI003F3B0013
MQLFGDARIVPGADPEPHLAAEILAVDELMRTGFISQLFRRLDGTGAVLIIESESKEAAELTLAELPFVKNEVMRIPLTAIAERPRPAK